MLWTPALLALVAFAAFLVGLIIAVRGCQSNEDYWMGVARKNANLARKATKQCEEWRTRHEKAPSPAIHDDLAGKDKV